MYATDLSSFDKTRYSTFKVEVLEFIWMWNNSFCEMTIVVKYVQHAHDRKTFQMEWVPTLSSFDKTRYSTFKVEVLEFSWMWNNVFCEMTIEIPRCRSLQTLYRFAQLWRNKGAPPDLVRICFSKETPFTLYPRPQVPSQIAKAKAKVTSIEAANCLVTFLVVFFISAWFFGIGLLHFQTFFIFSFAGLGGGTEPGTPHLAVGKR